LNKFDFIVEDKLKHLLFIMPSFSDKLQNKKEVTKYITSFKCDKCGECKAKYFIHMNIDNSDKYICSYLCSKDMHINYGKNYWDNLVNIEDFQHPRPLQIKNESMDKFKVVHDPINNDRNEFIQSLEEEDKRVEALEKDYEYNSSDSSDMDYD